MEAWEALDLDESELPSFIRPCSKRIKQTHQTNKTQFLVLDDSPSASASALASQTITPHSQFLHQPPPTAPSPRIPGPAGAVQSAMLLKAHDNRILLSVGEEPIPTQEYVRRAVEDSSHFHDDFSLPPWVFALHFIRSQGLVGSDGVDIGTPLSEIKNGFSMEKVPRVVAIVKSCTSNGFGDLMVTLKDPTGTIDAAIHHRVLSEGDFGKEIAVGAVIILQKVAVFSPSHSASYLNITLGNVVKVMSKRCGHLLEENYSASTAKHTAPVEICSKSCMPPKAFSLSQERTERIMNNPRENSSESGRRHSDRELEELEVAPVSSNKKNTVGEKEPFLVKENVGGAMKKLVGGFDSTDNDRCFLLGEQPNRWTQSGSVLCSGAAEILVEVSNQGKDNTNEVKKQSQRFSLRGSLPQWTDEQLDELFV